MKLNYYSETDSLYINLSSKTSVETKEISEGLNIDLGEDGTIVGIDIDNASKKIDLQEFTFSRIPSLVE